MAFGSAWGTKDWDSTTILPIIEAEIRKSWLVRQIGDFAVGLLPSDSPSQTVNDKAWQSVQLQSLEALEQVQWIGYAGVRDATTTSMPSEATSRPSQKPWTQMVELRYGFSPLAWGKGYGTEAALAVMEWCSEAVGAERFIAETENENAGSGKILRKLGFERIGEQEVIWGMDGTVEWQRTRCANSGLQSLLGFPGVEFPMNLRRSEVTQNLFHVIREASFEAIMTVGEPLHGPLSSVGAILVAIASLTSNVKLEKEGSGPTLKSSGIAFGFKACGLKVTSNIGSMLCSTPDHLTAYKAICVKHEILHQIIS